LQPVFSSLALLGHPLHAQSEQLHDPAPVEEHIFPQLYVVKPTTSKELVSVGSRARGKSREESKRGKIQGYLRASVLGIRVYRLGLPVRAPCAGALSRTRTGFGAGDGGALGAASVVNETRSRSRMQEQDGSVSHGSR
jgi:hypothetical protein